MAYAVKPDMKRLLITEIFSGAAAVQQPFQLCDCNSSSASGWLGSLIVGTRRYKSPSSKVRGDTEGQGPLSGWRAGGQVLPLHNQVARGTFLSARSILWGEGDANVSVQAIAGQCEALTVMAASSNWNESDVNIEPIIINGNIPLDYKWNYVKGSEDSGESSGFIFAPLPVPRNQEPAVWLGQMHHLVAQSGNDIFNRTSDNFGLIFFFILFY